MCGGGRETHDILEAERLDRSETAHKGKSTNIQPSLLVQSMIGSEPCLFSNQSEVAVVPTEGDAMTLFRVGWYKAAIKWHAQIQVDYWHDLFSTKSMTVAHDQG